MVKSPFSIWGWIIADVFGEIADNIAGGMADVIERWIIRSGRPLCWRRSPSRFIFTTITSTKLINQIHQFLRGWYLIYPEHWCEYSCYLTKALNERTIEIGKTEKNLDIMYKFWFRIILHGIYSLFCYSYSLGWYNVP